MTSFTYDANRRVINTNDARLNRVLLRQPESCASISEYAQQTGIDAADIINLFAAYLDEGSVALEFVSNEMFLLTAPHGRPMAPGLADVPPNLWEVLRIRSHQEQAHRLWKLVRGLQRVGWPVQTSASRIMSGMGRVHEEPLLGVDVGNTTVPLVIYPASDALSTQHGILSDYDLAGAKAIAVVCDNGALDEMVTATRRWVLDRWERKLPAPGLSVLVLEAPGYNPTLLTPADAAVEARDVTVQRILSAEWTPERTPQARPYPHDEGSYGTYVR